MSHELRKAGTKVVNRMSRLFYHEHPEALTLETSVADAQPGRIVLSESPFFAGGGGQLPDKGVIRWNGGEIAVTGFEPQGGRTGSCSAKMSNCQARSRLRSIRTFAR